MKHHSVFYFHFMHFA